MRRKKKFLAAAVGAALLVSSLNGCGKESNKKEQVKLSVWTSEQNVALVERQL